MPPSPRLRRRLAAVASLALLPGLAAAATSPMASADPTAPSSALAPADLTDLLPPAEATEEATVVEVRLDDTAQLDRLVATGVDVASGVEQQEDGLSVAVVVTPTQAEALTDAGFALGETLFSPDSDAADARAEQQRTMAQHRRANRAFAQRAADPTAPDVSDVRIVRAQYFTSYGDAYLSVEAKLADGQTSTAPLTVERDAGPGTEFGAGGTQVITRFVDAGVYLYHRGQDTAPVRPDRVRITSPSGDVAIADVTDWLPAEGDDPFKGPGYQEDFITSYLDPTQLDERMDQLEAEFPGLVELVDLPHQTEGYRRKAQAVLDPPGDRVVVSAGDAQGEYAYVPSTTLGGPVPTGGLAGPVEAAVSGASTAFPNATPAMGCGPITGLTAGAIALVDRGECGFAVKASNAQAAGASAVVIANNVSGAPTAPGGTDATVTIPVVAVSQPDGATLRAAAPVAARLTRGQVPAANSRIGVDTLSWGHEGGNDVSVRLSRPSAPADAIAVRVAGRNIEVDLATDGTGTPTSTAGQVVAAINAHPRASQLVTAYGYRGSTGSGVVTPTRTIGLSDNLNAPDYVSHDPYTVRAMRIGTAPEGEKPGVLAIAQEHAREWTTPLITMETAERLLRNYGSHAPTKDLVDNLEVWVVPSVNPDGSHYSFYDFASQRKNMTRYCAPEVTGDALARNTWGVDNNRNYDTYSLFDGYVGASSSCTSATYAGPAELSEPENKNIDWLGAKPNMKFAMSLHSFGNYFLWSPGAYDAQRTTAPRPPLRDEQFFEQASDQILTGIKRHRGLAVTPARTGVTADVLYSAAGNSGDMLYYKHGLFAWIFESGVMFQPPFDNTDPEGPSAHAETMEFANGLVEMLRVARGLDEDTLAPSTSLVVEPAGTAGKVNVTFDTSEAVEIRYTTDGSRPTADNGETLEANGVREAGERLLLDEGTTVFWYATDSAGNVEGGYDPEAEGDRGYRKAIAEVGWELVPAESTVELSLDPSRTTVGSTIDATVSVTSENDFDLPPSGEVTVSVPGADPQVVELDDEGTGTTEIGPLTRPGILDATASYAGDDVSAAATSDDEVVEVFAASTTTEVVRQQPARVLTTGPVDRTRARLVVAVEATGVTPTGWVQVRRGGEVIARGRLEDGRTTIRLPRFPQAGTKQLRVVYNGTTSAAPSGTGYQLVVSRP